VAAEAHEAVEDDGSTNEETLGEGSSALPLSSELSPRLASKALRLRPGQACEAAVAVAAAAPDAALLLLGS
jgi:hypothetical protein